MDQLIREHGPALITILWAALGLAGAGFLGLLGFVWLLIRLWASSSKKTLDDQLVSMRDTDKELERKMEQLKDQELTAFKDKTSLQFATLHEDQLKAAAANDLAHSELKGAIGELKLEVSGRLDVLEKRMPNGELKELLDIARTLKEKLKLD